MAENIIGQTSVSEDFPVASSEYEGLSTQSAMTGNHPSQTSSPEDIPLPSTENEDLSLEDSPPRRGHRLLIIDELMAGTYGGPPSSSGVPAPARAPRRRTRQSQVIAGFLIEPSTSPESDAEPTTIQKRKRHEADDNDEEEEGPAKRAATGAETGDLLSKINN